MAPHNMASRFGAAPKNITSITTTADKKYFLLTLPYFAVAKIEEYLIWIEEEIKRCGEIGPESFRLGCIATLAPMLGYLDGMRVSADIHPNWNVATNIFEESKGNQHINNVWWQHDPDAMIIRRLTEKLGIKQSLMIDLNPTQSKLIFMSVDKRKIKYFFLTKHTSLFIMIP